MKSKKGEFIGEGLGLVLAIIGIVILGFLGFKLYNLFVSQDMKNAQLFVEGLNSKIEGLNDEENNTFALRGVEGWVLVAWNKSVPLKDKPEKCFDKNCLCLCKGKVDSVSCQENGYCRGVDRNVGVASNFTSSIDISAGYNARDVAIGTIFASCYIMPEKSILIPFTISKTSNNILITAPSQQTKDYANYLLINSVLRSCPFYRPEGTFGRQRGDNIK